MQPDLIVVVIDVLGPGVGNGEKLKLQDLAKLFAVIVVEPVDDYC